MTKYRILIVDDSGASVEGTYKKLFKNDASFDWRMSKSRSSFEKANFESFDAVLLDINLDRWDMGLADAVNIVGIRCPIVLVSQKWGESPTSARVQEVLALAKHVNFVQVLVLNDLLGRGWEKRVEGIQWQLRLSIASHRRRAVLDLPSDKPIHILHLSDPQYGDPGQESWAVQAEEEMVKSLRSIQPDIHFVAITGDITYQGHPKEFKTAKSKLGSFLSALFYGQQDWRERVLLVPGNHDVNLRLSAADQVTVKPSEKKLFCRKTKNIPYDLRRYALQPFCEFAWELTGDPNWRDSTDLCWINDSFRHLGLRFFLLNSASAIHCADPKTAMTPSLELLAKSCLPDKESFGIALSHHGPIWAKQKRIEGLSNWPGVSKSLQNCGVRLFIHGHGHERSVEKFPLGTPPPRPKDPSGGALTDDEFLRIMAPTTHLNEKKRADGAYRGFNFITLQRPGGIFDKVSVDTYKLDETRPSIVARQVFSL